jgi:hypothetical protein
VGCVKLKENIINPGKVLVGASKEKRSFSKLDVDGTSVLKFV